MSAQQNQHNITQIKKLFDEGFSKGNFAIYDEVMATNVKYIDPAMPTHRDGLQAVKEAERIYQRAFPNKKVKIDDIFAAEDRVVVMWTCHATQKGDLQGIPATNRDIKVSGISIYRFANGKITEIRQIYDRLALLEQIGEIQPAVALH